MTDADLQFGKLRNQGNNNSQKKENKIVKDVRVDVIKFIEEQFANVNKKN
ncbi:hypothetical protein [Helcococcus ovis]